MQNLPVWPVLLDMVCRAITVVTSSHGYQLGFIGKTTGDVAIGDVSRQFPRIKKMTRFGRIVMKHGTIIKRYTP